MELLPALRLGWLNGWIMLILLSLTDAISFLLFPKKVVARLFDRSGWSRKQQIFTIASKLLAVVFLTLLALTPLKIGHPIFFIGITIAVLGLIGLVRALIDFKNTPLDQPVTSGLYRVSRHPQIVMSTVVLLGASVAIGSWLALIILMIARLFGHFGILAEEEVCKEKYGNAYQAYLIKVPRYFLFF